MVFDAEFAFALNALTLIDGSDDVFAGNGRSVAVGSSEELLLFDGAGEEISFAAVHGAEAAIADLPAFLFCERDRAIAVKAEL